jgi:hypothetical protein
MGHNSPFSKCFLSSRPVESETGANRRSCAALAKIPDGNAEPSRLVGKIALNAGTPEQHDADRKDGEHGVVALERCGLGMFRPIWLEADLWHLMIGRPDPVMPDDGRSRRCR